ncbi:SDR family oxidoreductase [Dyella sp. A6]|uniref:SDR family oxidoreductase n=1 Tax=Dyella aluminiiresistens TaxID=3069105 RepID=UPI002E779946|nr:SDR family oxidoreductase [Dyella sp. A6]
MNPTDNTILITGGGSGIGRALADAFQARGNTVIVTGRRLDLLQAVVAGKPDMHAMSLDISQADAVAVFARRVVMDFPRLNVVINNAGIMRAENLLADTVDQTDAETTVATNLLGPMRLNAALLPHLRAQPRAAILNVSSGLAFVPRADTPTYNATKAAIHSYSQSLRFQLRHSKVQVHELVPPYVQTELMSAEQANDPLAMPLADFIEETMSILDTAPDVEEVLVERVLPLRHAERGDYSTFFRTFNERLATH